MTSLDGLNVSRETSDLLLQFSALVERWTVKINLISKASVGDIWKRHVADSAQLFELAPEFDHWVDLGSGGGFPGIVIAIIGKEAQPDAKITLVESDLRKATFLRTAIRELGLNATVIADRNEEMPSLCADVLSARALADLPTLLEYADLHLVRTGTAIFPKGQNWRKEDEAARELWSYTLEPVKSKTSAEAAILLIKDVSRV
ncbi:16S rRNA (guanine(527)-N(7))-methyltransferase RsmG [Sulfitobacter sp. EhC04]|uniref:16S rRNA (guanine(527)-N(7))-methyltransferase RsmG n=1 Tax=Sulfitobacter sp. EhC04 TaxID=1849168 RepID=UPI0007F4AE39|nr:16S rRNA (guanine(527)-N(7))-methyltransferase RsmG [Sulfitobacter sp. EhC04]OAN67663.1 16S rRNA (guanine(527)-N(7))-methyltransferase RsmG [Sulfitobacter sp. EhC04]